METPTHQLPVPDCTFTGHYFAVGFSPWKKPLVRDFLPEARLTFVRSLRRVPAGAALVAWGRSLDPALAAAIRSGHLPSDTRVLRIEDGFLRSVGLGAGLARPLSWVLDPVGIHYDASAPSALEQLLQDHPFPVPLLQRAQRLIDRILALNLTKYNVGSTPWSPPPTRKPLLLVPGQVESDASLQFGPQTIRTNLALLQAVRAAHPDAFLLYKPHPDVAAGLRQRGPLEAQARAACDALVTDVPMGDLLQAVDQVHVMTSLTGFEALLRQKKVVCYGSPFYAGWGLTEDRLPQPRRQRSLSLPQLVAGALLCYATYVHPGSRQRIEAEDALETLAVWRKNPPAFRSNFIESCVTKLYRTFVFCQNKLYDLQRSHSI